MKQLKPPEKDRDRVVYTLLSYPDRADLAQKCVLLRRKLVGK
jgi:hypothetical protein